MNKGELVYVIAAISGTTKKDAEAIVSTFLDAIAESVAEGQKVAISGFGTFEPRQRSAREGRNPRTGEKIAIPASTLPGFSPSKAFKAAVAGV